MKGRAHFLLQRSLKHCEFWTVKTCNCEAYRVERWRRQARNTSVKLNCWGIVLTFTNLTFQNIIPAKAFTLGISPTLVPSFCLGFSSPKAPRTPFEQAQVLDFRIIASFTCSVTWTHPYDHDPIVLHELFNLNLRHRNLLAYLRSYRFPSIDCTVVALWLREQLGEGQVTQGIFM